MVHDPLRSPDTEGTDTATPDVLRDLLVQKRHVLLSKLQSQVSEDSIMFIQHHLVKVQWLVDDLSIHKIFIT